MRFGLCFLRSPLASNYQSGSTGIRLCDDGATGVVGNSIDMILGAWAATMKQNGSALFTRISDEDR